LTEIEADELRRQRSFPDWHYDPEAGHSAPFECKAADWGWHRGRLMALDRASEAIFP
jgi:hypothetical protein